MPFQAFAYRGRRVDVKGRTLEMAGRAERKVMAPLLSPRGAARWKRTTMNARAACDQHTKARSGWRKCAASEMLVGLTVRRLTRAARALVATAARHAACPHLKRAMQAA